MAASVSLEERAMIDAAVAAGNVTRCPTGKSALTLEYVWQDGKGLIAKDQEAAKRAYRGTMQRHFAKPKAKGPAPEQAKRRETVVAQMDAGMTREQIATLLGIHPHTVSADVKAMGRTFPRLPCPPKTTERVIARRAEVAKMVGEGKFAKQIAARVGVDPRTVWDDVKALGLQMPRVKPKGEAKPYSKRPKAEVLAARRAEVAKMIEQGMGGREIATKLGVTIHIVKHDARALGVKLPLGRRSGDEWLHATLSAHKSTACRLVSVMRKAGNTNDEIRETLLAIVREAA